MNKLQFCHIISIQVHMSAPDSLRQLLKWYSIFKMQKRSPCFQWFWPEEKIQTIWKTLQKKEHTPCDLRKPFKQTGILTSASSEKLK